MSERSRLIANLLIVALSCTRKFPFEWSLTKVFADPPAGWQPSEGDGGGRGRIQGASVRVD